MKGKSKGTLPGSTTEHDPRPVTLRPDPERLYLQLREHFGPNKSEIGVKYADSPGSKVQYMKGISVIELEVVYLPELARAHSVTTDCLKQQSLGAVYEKERVIEVVDDPPTVGIALYSAVYVWPIGIIQRPEPDDRMQDNFAG